MGNFAHAKLDEELTVGEIECIEMLDEGMVEKILFPPEFNDSFEVRYHRMFLMYCGANAITKEIERAPRHSVHCTNPALKRLLLYVILGVDAGVALREHYTAFRTGADKDTEALLHESSKLFDEVLARFREKCGPGLEL